MTAPSRRQYLASVVLAAGVAGCSSVSQLGGDDAETAESGLTVTGVEAAGSPGGEVPVKPPDEAALVDFFATWCAPCKPQMGELATVATERPDLHIVSITREDDREAIRQFWQEYDGNWPVGIDADLEAWQAYGVDNIPTKVLVDADGTEHWRHTGLAEADTILTEIDAAL